MEQQSTKTINCDVCKKVNVPLVILKVCPRTVKDNDCTASGEMGQFEDIM